jgi:hypothetical protein
MSFPCCVVFHVLVAPMFKGHPHSTPAFHTRIPHECKCKLLSKSGVRLALAALVKELEGFKVLKTSLNFKCL